MKPAYSSCSATTRAPCRESGFHWANPFYTSGPQNIRLPGAILQAKRAGGKSEPAEARPRALGRNKISLRARKLNGDTLKVNDKRGNPIEIAAVVVWRVEDTAQAMFDVDNYENYMRMQSESAVRHLASSYRLRRRRGGRSHAARRHVRRRVAGAARRNCRSGSSKAGVVGRGGAAHAPGLCARNRAGDAAAAAGRGRHRRAAEDRARRGEHGARWR